MGSLIDQDAPFRCAKGFCFVDRLIEGPSDTFRLPRGTEGSLIRERHQRLAGSAANVGGAAYDHLRESYVEFLTRESVELARHQYIGLYVSA